MRSTLIMSFFAFALPLMACSESPSTTINRDTNCSDICKKYKDCIQGDYDTDKCTSRCEDMKDPNETNAISDCQTCVDDKSCVNSAFQCASECSGIVP